MLLIGKWLFYSPDLSFFCFDGVVRIGDFSIVVVSTVDWVSFSSSSSESVPKKPDVKKIYKRKRKTDLLLCIRLERAEAFRITGVDDSTIEK